MTVEALSLSEVSVFTTDLPIQNEGSSNGRIFKEIAVHPVEKINSIASSIFKTFGVITLTSSIVGLFSLNPVAGLVLGVNLSVIASPFVVAYHIASKIFY